MADKISVLDECANRIIDDLIAITSNKLRSISGWHVGIYNDVSFNADTVKNFSVFLTYKINNHRDCLIIYKMVKDKLQLLPDLNVEESQDTNPQYLVFWHSLGVDAEKPL